MHQHADDDYIRLVEIISQVAEPEKLPTLSNVLSKAEEIFRQHELPEDQCERLREAVYRLSAFPHSDWLAKLAKLETADLSNLSDIQPKMAWPLPTLDPLHPSRSGSFLQLPEHLEDHSNPEMSPAQASSQDLLSLSSLPEMLNPNQQQPRQQKKKKARKRDSQLRLVQKLANFPKSAERRSSPNEESSPKFIAVPGFAPNSAVKKALERKNAWRRTSPSFKRDPNTTKHSVIFASPSFDMKSQSDGPCHTPSPILLAQELNPNFNSQTPTPHEVYTPSPLSFLNECTPRTPEMWRSHRRMLGYPNKWEEDYDNLPGFLSHVSASSTPVERRGILTLEDLEPSGGKMDEDADAQSSNHNLQAASFLAQVLYIRAIHRSFKEWKLKNLMEQARDRLATNHHDKRLLRSLFLAWRQLTQQSQLPESVKVMALFRWVLHQLSPSDIILWLACFDKSLCRSKDLQLLSIDPNRSSVVDSAQMADFAGTMFRTNLKVALFTHWHRWTVLQKKGNAFARRKAQLRVVNTLIRLAAQGRWWRARMQQDMDCQKFLQRLHGHAQSRKNHREQDRAVIRKVYLLRASRALHRHAGREKAFRQHVQTGQYKYRRATLWKGLCSLQNYAKSQSYSRQLEQLASTKRKASLLSQAIERWTSFTSQQGLLKIAEHAVRRRLRTLALSRALGIMACNADAKIILKIARNAIMKRKRKLIVSYVWHKWYTAFQLRQALAIIFDGWRKCKLHSAFQVFWRKCKLAEAFKITQEMVQKRWKNKVLQLWRQQLTANGLCNDTKEKRQNKLKHTAFQNWVFFYRKLQGIRKRFQTALVSWAFCVLKNSTKNDRLDRDLLSRAEAHRKFRVIQKLQNFRHSRLCRRKVLSGYGSILQDKALHRCLRKWRRHVQSTLKLLHDRNAVWHFQSRQAWNLFVAALQSSVQRRKRYYSTHEAAMELHTSRLLHHGIRAWNSDTTKRCRLQKKLAQIAFSHHVYTLSAHSLHRLQEMASRRRHVQLISNRTAKALCTLKKQQVFAQWRCIQKIRFLCRRWIPVHRYSRMHKVFHALRLYSQTILKFKRKLRAKFIESDKQRCDACFDAWRAFSLERQAVKECGQAVLEVRQHRVQLVVWQQWQRRARTSSKLRQAAEEVEALRDRHILWRHWNGWYRQKVLLVERLDFERRWSLRRGFRWIKGNKHKQRQLLNWTTAKVERRELRRSMALWKGFIKAMKPSKSSHIKARKHWVHYHFEDALKQWRAYTTLRKYNKRLARKAEVLLIRNAVEIIQARSTFSKITQSLIDKAKLQQHQIRLRGIFNRWSKCYQERKNNKMLAQSGQNVVQRVVKRAALKKLGWYCRLKAAQKVSLSDARSVFLGAGFQTFFHNCQKRISQSQRQQKAEDLSISSRLQKEARAVLNALYIFAGQRKQAKQQQDLAEAFAKRQVLWRWRIARAEKHLYRFKSHTLLPLAFHRWKWYTAEHLAKNVAVSKAEEYYRAKNAKLLIACLRRSQSSIQGKQIASFHFKKVKAYNLFHTMIRRRKMKQQQRSASQFFVEKNMRTALLWLQKQIIENQGIYRHAVILGARSKVRRAWQHWKLYIDHRIYVQDLSVVVRQTQNKRYLKKFFMKIQKSFEHRITVKKSVLEVLIGFKKRLLDEGIHRWHCNSQQIGRVNRFIHKRIEQDNYSLLQLGFSAIKMYHSKCQECHIAFQQVWVLHARKVLGLRLSEWQTQFRIMSFVNDVMGSNRWGRVLLHSLFHRWATYTKTQLGIVAGVRSRHLRVPRQHMATRVLPKMLHFLEAKAYASWVHYWKIRKLRTQMKLRGDQLYAKRYFNTCIARWKKWTSMRKCIHICQHFWLTKVKGNVLERLQERADSHRKRRTKFYCLQHHLKQKRCHASLMHWSSVIQSLAAEKPSDQRANVTMRHFYLRKLFKRLMQRVSVMKKFDNTLAMAQNHWEAISLYNGVGIWLACIEEKKPLKVKKEVALIKSRRKSLKQAFVPLVINLSKCRKARQDAYFISKFHEQLRAKTLWRRWLTLHQRSQSMWHREREIEVSRHMPFHPLRWGMVRLKKHTLLWSTKHHFYCQQKAVHFCKKKSLRKMLEFVHKATKTREQEYYGSRAYKKRLQKPAFTNLLVCARSRQRKRKREIATIKIMESWRLQKSCCHWSKVAQKLKDGHDAQKLHQKHILTRCMSAWMHLTAKSRVLGRCQRKVQGCNFKKILNSAFYEWYFAFKVSHTAKCIQKRRFLKCLKRFSPQSLAKKNSMALSVKFQKRRALKAWVAGVKRNHMHLNHMVRLTLHAWRAYKTKVLSARVHAEAKGHKWCQILVIKIFVSWRTWMQSRLYKKATRLKADAYLLKTKQQTFLANVSHNLYRHKQWKLQLEKGNHHCVRKICSRVFLSLKSNQIVKASLNILEQKAHNHYTMKLCEDAKRMLRHLYEDLQSSKISNLHAVLMKRKVFNQWHHAYSAQRMFGMLVKTSFCWLAAAFVKWHWNTSCSQYIENVNRLHTKQFFRQFKQVVMKLHQIRVTENDLLKSAVTQRKRAILTRWSHEFMISRFHKCYTERLTKRSFVLWKTWSAGTRKARLEFEKAQAEEHCIKRIENMVHRRRTKSSWYLWMSEYTKHLKVKEFMAKMAQKRELRGLDFKLKRRVFNKWTRFAKQLPPNSMTKCLKVYLLRRRSVLERWKKAVVVSVSRKECLLMICNAKTEREDNEAIFSIFQCWNHWTKAVSFSEWFLMTKCLKEWQSKMILKKQMLIAKHSYRHALLSKVLFYWWSFAAARNPKFHDIRYL